MPLAGAAQAGADLLGIIFADAWRRVPVEQAQQMVKELRERIESPPPVVGVFVNQPAEEVNRTAEAVGLDMVQLHGEETPEYWARIEWPLIVARRIPSHLSIEEAAEILSPVVEYVEPRESLSLVEPRVEGAPGGAGVSLGTEMAAGLARRYPFILAGGLTPNSVGDVVRTVRPWGVDVSSGVETDEVKDAAKVRSFVEAVRAADAPKSRELPGKGLLAKLPVLPGVEQQEDWDAYFQQMMSQLQPVGY